MKIDHHLHTSKHSPDSVMHPWELIRQAKAAGLDGVVITEHDYQWRPDELEELSDRADGLLVLSGVEVSTMEGHMLVYGLPDLSGISVGIRLRDLLAIVEDHGAAIVAAHPYRFGQDFDQILGEHGPCFHGLELVSNNVSPPSRERVAATLERFPQFGRTGSSDAHDGEDVGCYHSVFPEPIRSMSDFVAAIRGRKGRPGSCAERYLVSGPID